MYISNIRDAERAKRGTGNTFERQRLTKCVAGEKSVPCQEEGPETLEMRRTGGMEGENE